jgi:hypothetical protein
MMLISDEFTTPSPNFMRAIVHVFLSNIQVEIVNLSSPRPLALVAPSLGYKCHHVKVSEAQDNILRTRHAFLSNITF